MENLAEGWGYHHANFFCIFCKTLPYTIVSCYKQNMTPETFIELYAQGYTLKAIQARTDAPTAMQLLGWVEDPDFMRRMEQVLKLRGLQYFDQLDDLKDNLHTVNNKTARLKSNILQWLAEKSNPQQFGSQLKVSVERKLDLTEALSMARRMVNGGEPPAIPTGSLALPIPQTHDLPIVDAEFSSVGGKEPEDFSDL